MTDSPLHINVKLNARLQPEHRLQLFEDPLDAMLDGVGIGEILGGGTALSDDGEVEYGDLEIQLHDAAALPQVIELLEQLGAPKGSLIQRDGEDDLPFGITEGLGLYLDGVNLPDEVYEQCDSNYVFDQIVERIDGHGEICSWWQGPSETALYLYGASFDTLRDRIADLLASYPLCQGARVVRIA
ncbi:hypothetical protein [Stenotrophomonas sp. GZD-301]|uniref:hypothetical protein n=1 Tax=Stenotrophomonas sp. GZD-301 TaxID=3404814 RepID=UPI003BB72909